MSLRSVVLSFSLPLPAGLAAAVFAAVVLALAAPASSARAQATCADSTGDACLTALTVQRGADAVVDDIFTTSDGLFAPQLSFGRYMRGVNGCIGWTGWNGTAITDAARLYEPQRRRFLDQYQCWQVTETDDVGFFADSLDWYWTQVVRTDDTGAGVADGANGFYYPWRGRLYDLGGEANRVVVFPISDHGPLPCESFEYSIWLTNNPDATEIAPESAPDPNLWNPARLVRVFEQGWTRNELAAGAVDRDRGDLGTFLRDNTLGEAVSDSLVTVWALPCGITFRYASVQGGNYGNPDPACTFHSSEDELDAVAGLNEDNTAICIDADGDGHRDAACGGGDCDDTNPAIHPGAFERCDATEDLDCQAMRECPEGTVCDPDSGLCAPQCFEGGCESGFTCIGSRCVDAACAALEEPCAPGTLCRAGVCVAPCDGVVCPAGQSCTGGACLDPCDGVVCPSTQVCIAREPGATQLCGPACNCAELSVPLCPTGRACDAREGSPTEGECLDPGCETMSCAAGEVCVSGACVDGCASVVCPRGQSCREGACELDLCAGIACPSGQVCREGDCVSACDGVSCRDGYLCQDGACVPDPCFGVSCSEGERCVSGTCVRTGPVPDAGGGRLDAGMRADAGGPVDPMDGGCGCRAAGTSGSAPAWLGLLGLGLLGVLALARRRRR